MSNETCEGSISVISASISTHTNTHYLRWKLFHFLCTCKRTYDTTLCATLLLAINYCHFLLRMASDIVIRLPGFRLVFLIWYECAKFFIDVKYLVVLYLVLFTTYKNDIHRAHKLFHFEMFSLLKYHVIILFW